MAPAKAQTPLEAIQEDRKNWHFEKRLSVDTLVGIIGVAVVVGGPVLFWGRAIEQRVVALETVNAEASKGDVRREADTREQRQVFAGRLDKIDDKMTVMQIAVGQLTTQIAAGQLAAATAAVAGTAASAGSNAPRPRMGR